MVVGWRWEHDYIWSRRKSTGEGVYLFLTGKPRERYLVSPKNQITSVILQEVFVISSVTLPFPEPPLPREARLPLWKPLPHKIKTFFSSKFCIHVSPRKKKCAVSPSALDSFCRLAWLNWESSVSYLSPLLFVWSWIAALLDFTQVQGFFRNPLHVLFMCSVCKQGKDKQLALFFTAEWDSLCWPRMQ